MALTKAESVVRTEVLANGILEVCTETIIKEDGVQISQSYTRRALVPSSSSPSGETAQVTAIADAVWTAEVVTAYEASL